MAKKKTKNTLTNYILPSNNEKLEMITHQKKLELMEQIVKSIEYAIVNNLPFVEVFQFENSDFVIEISDKDFLSNINNIFKHYMKHEVYEYCPRVIKLQNVLKKQVEHIINNEK